MEVSVFEAHVLFVRGKGDEGSNVLDFAFG